MEQLILPERFTLENLQLMKKNAILRYVFVDDNFQKVHSYLFRITNEKDFYHMFCILGPQGSCCSRKCSVS